MRTLFDCDMANERLAEKGIMFICPNPHCPLRSECPYAARTCNEEGGAK